MIGVHDIPLGAALWPRRGLIRERDETGAVWARHLILGIPTPWKKLHSFDFNRYTASARTLYWLRITWRTRRVEFCVGASAWNTMPNPNQYA